MREPAYQIDLPHIYSGKVRDIYDAGNDRLLMVTSDRLSAFDVVMAQPVPDKGRVLTGVSAFWFDELDDVVGNHLVSTDLADAPGAAQRPELEGRIMLTRRAEMLPVECIARGYITGSAWKEYLERGTVHGQTMPNGLRKADRLEQPIFTPSTKADDGLHDENIDFDRAAELVGGDVAEQLRDLTLAVYDRAAARASEAGILLADTKLEFGFVDGALVVADEMLTPDSSRFWPADAWAPGATPPSFDKQPVRDYLDTLDWPKTPPPPILPDEVIAATSRRYIEAYERLTGQPFSDWPGSPVSS